MFLVSLQKVVKSEQFLTSSGNKLKTCEAWSCNVLLISGLSNCKPLLDLKHLCLNMLKYIIYYSRNPVN